jgi:class 3 adenylate cyclase
LIILEEQNKSGKLLLNILPKQVAEELKIERKATTKQFDKVTILFSDFKDFTLMASSISPIKLVEELNEIFSHFDDIMETFQLEKIETIGDAYFAAC